MALQPLDMGHSMMTGQNGYAFAGFFEGPKGKVARVTKALGLDPDRDMRRSGRLYRVQVHQMSRVTVARFEQALQLWESMY
jgi:hypothetical protein